MLEPRLLLAFFLCSACAAPSLQLSGPLPTAGGRLRDEARKADPEPDPRAPGMIPAECEALLNKASELGASPGGNAWKPGSPEEALGALRFFSEFHLTPKATAEFIPQWLAEPQPASEGAARLSLDRMDKAQNCDALFASQLLRPLAAFRWPDRLKAEARQLVLRFLLNQQTRPGSSLSRAVQLDFLLLSVQRGLVRADRKKLQAIKSWFEKTTQDGLLQAEALPEDAALSRWKLHRRELQAAEELRDRLGRVLPLP